MNTAERARRAAREHPFLVAALRAGVVNYTAAARYLDVGDVEAVAAALRRFADEIGEGPATGGTVRLRMLTGVGPAEATDDALVVVGDRGFELARGDLTAIVAEGEVPPGAVGIVHWRLAEAGVRLHASAWEPGQLVVVTDRSGGPDVLRAVEGTLAGNSRD